MADADMARASQTELKARVCNVFGNHCVGIKLTTGRIVIGSDLNFFKAEPQVRTSRAADEFIHHETVTSMEINHRRVHQVTVINRPGTGSGKALEVIYPDEEDPVIVNDRRVAVELQRIPPQGAEVTRYRAS